MVPSERARWKLLVLSLATIGVGLATRRAPGIFPRFVVAYGGDVLWATLVYWLLTWARPAARGVELAVMTASIALAVEVSQLFTPPWLVALRANPFGALVLGQGFLWSDIACYAAGVALAWRLDAWGVARPSAARIAAVDD